jgi:hypothetical protein
MLELKQTQQTLSMYPNSATRIKDKIQILSIPLDALQELKYLGVMATNQIHTHKEVKSKCNSKNTCYR